MKNETRLGTIEAIVLAIATLGGWMNFTTADKAHKGLRNAEFAVSRGLVRDAWKVRTITTQEMELIVPAVLADKPNKEPTTVQPPRVVEGGKTRKSGRTTITDDDLFDTLSKLRADDTNDITSAMKAIRYLRSNGISASQARVHATWQATAPATVQEEE